MSFLLRLHSRADALQGFGRTEVFYVLGVRAVKAILFESSSLSCRNSSIAEQFTKEYPGMSLHEHLAQFSLPTPLGEQANPLWQPQQKVR